jgi:ribulose-bisphosphate carboxylase large chain
MSQGERIRITYLITLSRGETPEGRARHIALEQTVELPDGCYPPGIEERVVGRVESVERDDAGRWRVVLSFAADVAGEEVPQLLNLLFGNVSMLPGTVAVDLELPGSLLQRFGGPRFGVPGIRRACGNAEGRPLLCTSAKPVGLSSAQLAEICGALARGGIDVVKDDHGVTDQATAPFADRVRRCRDAVREANERTGGNTLYFPHVTAPVGELEHRVEIATEAGCQGVLLSPFLSGLDTVRWLAETSGLILLLHPTFSGALGQEGHGIAPALLFGTLLRLIGGDGVIYVNAGGRFPVTEAQCSAINARLRAPLGDLQAALPVPGGGVDAERVGYWIDRYGTDTMFLIGSSLYAQGELESASRKLADAVREHCHG